LPDENSDPVWHRATLKEELTYYCNSNSEGYSVIAVTVTEHSEQVQRISGALIKDPRDGSANQELAYQELEVALKKEKKISEGSLERTIRVQTNWKFSSPNLFQHILPYYPQGTPVTVTIPPYTLSGEIVKEHNDLVQSVLIFRGNEWYGETGNIVKKGTRAPHPQLRLKAEDSYDVLLDRVSEVSIESIKGKSLRAYGKVQFYDVKLDESSRKFVESLTDGKGESESFPLLEIHGSMLSPPSFHQLQGWEYKKHKRSLVGYFKTTHSLVEKSHFLDVGDAVLTLVDRKAHLPVYKPGVVCGLSQISDSNVHPTDAPKTEAEARQQWVSSRCDAYEIHFGDGAGSITSPEDGPLRRKGEHFDWRQIRPLGKQHGKKYRRYIRGSSRPVSGYLLDERRKKYAVDEPVLCNLGGTNDFFEAVITGVNSEGPVGFKQITYSVRYNYAREKGIITPEKTDEEHSVSAWRLSRVPVLDTGSFCPSIHHAELHTLPVHPALTQTTSKCFFRCVVIPYTLMIPAAV
jgi:hypothetical protein